MEAIVAFGLACNVVQVVDFALKVTSKCAEIARTGSTLEVQDYQNTSNQLANLTEGLNAAIDRAPKPLTRDDQDLLDLSRKCSGAAAELQHKLEELSTTKNRGKRNVIGKAFKTFTSDRAIRDLHRRLTEYERVLNTRILVRMSRQCDTTAVIQDKEFSNLNGKVQNIIVALSLGIRTVSDLISNEQRQTQVLLQSQHIATQNALKEEHITTRDAADVENLLTRNIVHSEHVETRATILSGFQNFQHDAVNEKDHQKLFDSLYFSEIDARRDDIEQAHQETFEWIFDESTAALRPWHNFVDWLKNSSGMYWINGKAGSGKSTLMKFICHHNKTHHYLSEWRQDRVCVLRFFFWRAGSKHQKSFNGLLRSLLYQLLKQSSLLIDQLLAQFPELRFKESAATWSTRELSELFSLGTHLLGRPLCIFLDGLDEFDGDEDDLLELIKSLSINSGIKLCLSSRPSEHLKSFFMHAPHLRLQDLTKPDIERYVTDLIGKHLKLESSRDQDIQVLDFTREVVWKAEGVFLWVHLAIKSVLRGLKNKDTWEELHQRLQVLPNGLEELYSHMWSRLNEDDPIYTEKAALWLATVLCCARGSYTLSLLDFAISVSPDLQKDILDSETLPRLDCVVDRCELVRLRIPAVCAGLLEVKGDMKDGQFINSDVTTENDREASAAVCPKNLENLAYLSRDERNWAKSETCPFNFLADGDFSEGSLKNSQRQAWMKLRSMNEKTHVSFIHRSAVDFLTDTAQGKSIFGGMDVSNVTTLLCLLRADLVSYALRIAPLNMSHLTCQISKLDFLLRALALPSESAMPDVLDMLGFYWGRMVTQINPLEEHGEWFEAARARSLTEDFEWHNREFRWCKDFLGLLLSQMSARSLLRSRWVMAQIQDANPTYKNYLLSCGLREGNCDGIKFMLDTGADPNSKFDITDTGGDDSCWQVFLAYVWFTCCAFTERRDQKFCAELWATFTSFVDHDAKLDETLYIFWDGQDFWTRNFWWRPLLRLPERNIFRGIQTPPHCAFIAIASNDIGELLKRWVRKNLIDLSRSPGERVVIHYSDDDYRRPENSATSQAVMAAIKSAIQDGSADTLSLISCLCDAPFEDIRDRMRTIPMKLHEVYEFFGIDEANPIGSQKRFLAQIRRRVELVQAAREEMEWARS